MKPLKLIIITILASLPFQGFAQSCSARSIYSFISAVINKDQVICNFRCHLYGCDGYIYNIPGKFIPAHPSNWTMIANKLECRIDENNCNFLIKEMGKG